MAKRNKASRSRKSLYRAETYGIKFNSLTFLLFALFALVVSVLLVSSMLGISLY
ncbi:MAG: hypothetical protein AAB702_00350 [Patescibacteria group bacterium]